MKKSSEMLLRAVRKLTCTMSEAMRIAKRDAWAAGYAAGYRNGKAGMCPSERTNPYCVTHPKGGMHHD